MPDELQLLARLPIRKPAAWVLSGDPRVVQEARENGEEVTADADAA